MHCPAKGIQAGYTSLYPPFKLLLILQDLTRSHLGDVFPRREASFRINNVTNPYFLVSHYRVDQDLLSIPTGWLNVWFPARLMSFLRAQQVLIHLEIATPQTPGCPRVAVQERAFELKWGTIPMSTSWRLLSRPSFPLWKPLLECCSASFSFLLRIPPPVRFYSESPDTLCGSITDVHLPHSMGLPFFIFLVNLGRWPAVVCHLHGLGPREDEQASRFLWWSGASQNLASLALSVNGDLTRITVKVVSRRTWYWSVDF